MECSGIGPGNAWADLFVKRDETMGDCRIGGHDFPNYPFDDDERPGESSSATAAESGFLMTGSAVAKAIRQQTTSSPTTLAQQKTGIHHDALSTEEGLYSSQNVQFLEVQTDQGSFAMSNHNGTTASCGFCLRATSTVTPQRK